VPGKDPDAARSTFASGLGAASRERFLRVLSDAAGLLSCTLPAGPHHRGHARRARDGRQPLLAPFPQESCVAMSQPSRIQDLVQAKLAGRKIDPVGFIDKLLEVASEAGEIRCGLAGARTLRFELGGEGCEVELDAAQAKLRMLCARLSVLVSEGKGSTVSPYGGEGTVTPSATPLHQSSVRFTNTPGEQEFTMSAVSNRVPNCEKKENMSPAPNTSRQ
jgi:hypothetical protein